MILLSCFRMFMLVVMLFFSAFMASAQNTTIPEPITTTNPAFTWDSSVFSDGIGAFALGHQWGTPVVVANLKRYSSENRCT